LTGRDVAGVLDGEGKHVEVVQRGPVLDTDLGGPKVSEGIVEPISDTSQAPWT